MNSGQSGAVQPSLDGTIETWPDVPEGGWHRVLLKLSGEAFAGGQGLGVDPDVVHSIAEQIADVVRHVDTLGSTEYWRRYDSLELVVLFLPAESLLAAALEVRPDLLQHAFDRDVVLATPTTLLAILRISASMIELRPPPCRRGSIRTWIAETTVGSSSPLVACSTTCSHPRSGRASRSRRTGSEFPSARTSSVSSSTSQNWKPPKRS